MKRVIYKYPLIRGFGERSVRMPSGSKVVTVDEQYGQVTVWAEVTPGLPEEQRRFYLVPTGGDVPLGFTHAATVFFEQKTLVVHIYELAQ